jgi:hypothetical protein
MTKKPNDGGDTAADDALWGGPAIAHFIGVEYRNLSYLFSTGKLEGAVVKLGPKLLIGSKAKLRAKLGLAERPAAAPVQVSPTPAPTPQVPKPRAPKPQASKPRRKGASVEFRAHPRAGRAAEVA